MGTWSSDERYTTLFETTVRLTGPGQPYELVDELGDGDAFVFSGKVMRHAPEADTTTIFVEE